LTGVFLSSFQRGCSAKVIMLVESALCGETTLGEYSRPHASPTSEASRTNAPTLQVTAFITDSLSCVG
jgi:hypothetical protein